MIYKDGPYTGYDGLERIDNGDHLTIYDFTNQVIFSGIISPDLQAGWTEFPGNKGHGQPSALGCWIHWTQAEWKPDDWAQMFFNGLRAELIKKEQ